MAVGTLNPAMLATGAPVTKKRPGHFVALTDDDRIDAVLAQGGSKLGALLEKRAPININNILRGPADGSAALTPVYGDKSVDPYDVAIVMPAVDGEPIVSDAEKDAWICFRVAYDVVLEATPYRVAGVVYLLPSQEPLALTELGTELFVPVFQAVVQNGGITVPDVPKGAILVNRSRIRKVSASMGR
jgi:hypothetical protein